jgi:hypothetical protein
MNWSGEVDQNWKDDYLMISDANLGSLKSDYYVKRSFEYSVDLSKDVPTANLKITYQHTAQQKDWMTKDYLDYLRIYTQDGSWLTGSKNTGDVKFYSEFGKKAFGTLIRVPLGQTKTIEFTYNLPKDFKDKAYDLKIQKQSGINDVPVKLHIIDANEVQKDYEFTMNSDIILSSK